jgi:hypothetical protein
LESFKSKENNKKRKEEEKEEIKSVGEQVSYSGQIDKQQSTPQVL